MVPSASYQTLPYKSNMNKQKYFTKKEENQLELNLNESDVKLTLEHGHQTTHHSKSFSKLMAPTSVKGVK